VRGRVHCWDGGSLWIGEADGSAQLHEHHAVQISLSFSGTIRFKTRQHDWRSFAAAFVPPHLPHAFEGAAQFTAQVFIEPETLEGRALLGRFRNDAITELPSDDIALHAKPLRAVELREAHASDLERAARQLIDGLAGAHRPVVVDARIERMIRWLWQSDRPVSLGEGAAKVALSPGRFRHLFVEQTGQSFRSYQLWVRLQRAIEVLSKSAAATDAAHAAGFSDAAHLARTFRKMMGIAPTSVKLD